MKRAITALLSLVAAAVAVRLWRTLDGRQTINVSDTMDSALLEKLAESELRFREVAYACAQEASDEFALAEGKHDPNWDPWDALSFIADLKFQRDGLARLVRNEYGKDDLGEIAKTFGVGLLTQEHINALAGEWEFSPIPPQLSREEWRELLFHYTKDGIPEGHTGTEVVVKWLLAEKIADYLEEVEGK